MLSYTSPRDVVSKVMKKFSAVLSLVPILTFFTILAVMFLADFRNPTDEYFVRTILRGCLIIILATAVTQILSLSLMSIFYVFVSENVTPIMQAFFRRLSFFAFVDVFIFSIAIFYRTLTLGEWVFWLAMAMVIATVDYWLKVIHGPIKNMHVFARFHKIGFLKSVYVLLPFYFNAFNAYFFLALKKVLLPLTFIFVASDFKIIVPRLVDAGLSLDAFILFLSLIVSIHLLAYRPDTAA